jgi:hypothetical protein
MLKRLKPFLLSLLAAATLAGCASNDSPVDFPPLSFKRYQPIFLNVKSVEFVDEYKSPMRSPNVEHLMPYSPAEAMRIWVKDRLRIVGSDKVLQVIIKDGRVTASQIHKDNSIEDFFTIDQDRKYEAALDVELRIYGTESPLSEANVIVKATRSFTMSENASVWRRNYEFRKMIYEMMEAVNAELEKNMHQHMAAHINYKLSP